MSVARGRIDLGGNDVRAQGPGELMTSQRKQLVDATNGNATLTAQQITAGILRRTTAAANYADIFPSADSLLQACPQLDVGDSFGFILQNTVAFTNTPTGAEGAVLGNNTAIAASLVREYLITLLGDGIRQAFTATTTNASVTVTGVPAAYMAGLAVGQGVSGTGIQANSYITSINQATNSFTLSLAATATGTPALTTFPRYSVEGVRAGTA
jgi:hypothetical protein